MTRRSRGSKRGLSLAVFGLASGWLSAQSPAPVFFEPRVRSLLEARCVRCHNAGRSSGGLVLETHDRLMEGGASGAVVQPGDADASRLYRLVSHQEQPHMPPGGEKLDRKALETLRLWIQGGARRNASTPAPKAAAAANALAIAVPAGQRPAGAPPLPPRLGLEPFTVSPRANAVTALAASPWAPLLAAAGHQQVLLYHTDTLALLGILPFPEGIPHVLRFSRNGTLLLAGGGRGADRGRVALWRVATGKRVCTLGNEFDSVLAADLSPDQTRIALGGPGKVVRLLSSGDGRPIHELKKHTDWITAIAFSPDGVLLATGDRAGNVNVWEASTGEEYLTLPPHQGRVTALAWRVDSNVLATAGEDGMVRLFQAEDGKSLRRFRAHAGGTLGLCYARDGRLVSCGRDHQVKLWDPAGKRIRAFRSARDVVLGAGISHDLKRIFGGDWTGQVHAWDSANSRVLGAVAVNPPSIRTRLERIARELAEMGQRLTRAKRQEKALRSAAAEAGQRSAYLERRVRTAERAARSAGAEVARLAAAYQAKREALEQARARGETPLDQVTAVHAALRALGRAQRAHAPIEKRLRTARTELGREQAGMAQAEKRAADEARQGARAAKRIAGLEADRVRWRGEQGFAETLRALAVAETEWQAARNREREVRRRLRAAEQRSESTESEIDALEARIAAAEAGQEAAHSRQAEVEALRRQVETRLDLVRSLVTLTDELRRHAARIRAAGAESAAAHPALTALAAAQVELERFLSSLDIETEVARRTVERWTRLLAGCDGAVGAAKTAFTEAGRQVAALEKTLAGKKDAWQDLAIRVSTLRNQARQAARALEQAEARLDAARKTAERARARPASKRDDPRT